MAERIFTNSFPNSSNAAHVYKYSPLDTTEQTIRVFELYSNGNKELLCNIKHISLQNAEYQALSYVWGSPEKPYSIAVSDNDGTRLGFLPLTHNLCNALQDLMRSSGVKNKLFWIDQICINQEDDREKNLQVAMMGEIYKHATRVITYLGSEAPNDQEAISLIMELHEHFEPNYKQIFAGSWAALRYQKHSLPVHEMPNTINNNHFGWPDLLDMALGDWTRRLWMVQENLINVDTVMLRGCRVLPWIPVATMAILFAVNLLPLHVLNQFWQDRGYTHHPDDVINPLYFTIERRRRLKNSGKIRQQSLLHMVVWYESLICYDPRDRIYAVLAISKDIGIVPDYRISVKSLFINATLKLIKSLKSLAPLEYVTTLDNLSNDDLPSWSLGLQSNDEEPIIWDGRIYSPLDENSVWVEENNRVLVLTGQIVDEISFVTPAVRYPISTFFEEDNGERVQCCYQRLSYFIRLQKEAGMTLKSAGDLARVIFPNQTWVGDVAAFHFWSYLHESTKFVNDMAKKISMPLPLFDNDLQAIVDTMAHKIRTNPDYSSLVDAQQETNDLSGTTITDGRSFCMTSNGRMCNATSKAQKGDVIALLHGGSVPFVLRPAGDYFKFVGDCYVHDFMGMAPKGNLEIRLI